jgi:hypothetical protein
MNAVGFANYSFDDQISYTQKKNSVSENLTSVKFIEKFYCRSKIISLPQKNILLRQKKKNCEEKIFSASEKIFEIFC